MVENDFAKGEKLWAAIKPLMINLEQGGKFVQSIKYGVNLTGIDAGPPRLPLLPLEGSEKEKFETIVNQMNKTIDQLV